MERYAGQSSRWKTFQLWLNVAVKLTVPLAAITAAYLANRFEERKSIRTLVNQREEAESSLRATMFAQLIGPIIGSRDGQQLRDPDRYSLIVRMMALNFAEHFELRPMLQSADDLLASNQRQGDEAAVGSARWELRSVAHRIINRQIATLWEEKIAPCKPSGPPEVTIWVFSEGYPEEEAKSFEVGATPASQLYRLGPAAMPITLFAPNCKDKLQVSFAKPNWSMENIRVEVLRSPPESGTWSDQFEFGLTPFSFPFTDNTPLPNGNRFALFIKDVTRTGTAPNLSFLMRVGLRWFPKHYYPPTERPTNHKEVEDALGIHPDASGAETP